MLNISDNAVERISYLLNQDKKNFFRVSVIGGGCNGFKYEYDYAEEKSNSDLVITKGDVNILVDDISAPYLEGSVLEYEETLSSAEFKIVNPQATAKCGCGNSFAI